MKKPLVGFTTFCVLGFDDCSILDCGEDDEEKFTIVGSWVVDYAYLPCSSVHKCDSDGTYTVYSDYAMTNIYYRGTWRLSGTTKLRLGYVRSIMSVVDANKFELNGYTYYRKGHKFGGNAFAGSASSLTVGSTHKGDLIDLIPKLFAIFVEDGATYEIFWEDGVNKATDSFYTATIEISVYEGDKTTAYFEKEDNGYSSPKRIRANGTIMYILVSPRTVSNRLGTYSLTVTKQ